jgi:hypothetical protein
MHIFVDNIILNIILKQYNKFIKFQLRHKYYYVIALH